MFITLPLVMYVSSSDEIMLLLVGMDGGVQALVTLTRSPVPLILKLSSRLLGALVCYGKSMIFRMLVFV